MVKQYLLVTIQSNIQGRTLVRQLHTTPTPQKASHHAIQFACALSCFVPQLRPSARIKHMETYIKANVIGNAERIA